METLATQVSLGNVPDLGFLDGSVEAWSSILLRSFLKGTVGVLTFSHWLSELLHDFSDVLFDHGIRILKSSFSSDCLGMLNQFIRWRKLLCCFGLRNFRLGGELLTKKRSVCNLICIKIIQTLEQINSVTITYSIEFVGFLAEEILIKCIRVEIFVFQPRGDILVGILSPLSGISVGQGELFAALKIRQDLFLVEARVLSNKFLLDLFFLLGILLECLVSTIAHHEV